MVSWVETYLDDGLDRVDFTQLARFGSDNLKIYHVLLIKTHGLTVRKGGVIISVTSWRHSNPKMTDITLV
jgi:hypothetical protein